MTGSRPSRCACVQFLEPRRLLSATVPSVTGTFVGFVGTANDPEAADLTIIVATESKSGKLVGTFTETSSGNVNTRNFTGTVNSHNKLVLHIKKQVQPHLVIHPATLTGTASSDGNTLAGGSNSGGFRGTFSVARVTTP